MSIKNILQKTGFIKEDEQPVVQQVKVEPAPIVTFGGTPQTQEGTRNGIVIDFDK